MTQEEYKNRSITWQRGFVDGRRSHPPAELTSDYLDGFAEGDKHYMGPKVVCRCELCEMLGK